MEESSFIQPSFLGMYRLTFSLGTYIIYTCVYPVFMRDMYIRFFTCCSNRLRLNSFSLMTTKNTSLFLHNEFINVIV